MTDPGAVGAYLDHAATTPLRAEALDAMLPYLVDHFGNPSGLHATARRARRALDDARGALAEAFGCEERELVFTSGGTESDNLAILGPARETPGTVAVSAVEHRAVAAPASTLGAVVAPVDRDGTVALAALAALARRVADAGRPLSLVSVMLVNSETGLVEPVDEIARLVHELAPGALVHCDAVQAPTWLDVAVAAASCDLVSLSGHKFGGPKGVGALVVRERARPRLRRILHGGAQERELRSGTENVAGAVGMAAAARLAGAERRSVVDRVAALRDRLADGLVSATGAVEPAPRALRVAGNCHLRFPGVSGEEVVLLADSSGVAASTGSACASGAREPSPVLLAMGWSRREAAEAVRFSLGASTTSAEVDLALEVVAAAVARLRD